MIQQLHIFYDKSSASFDRVVFKKITNTFPYIKMYDAYSLQSMMEFKKHFLFGLVKIVIHEE